MTEPNQTSSVEIAIRLVSDSSQLPSYAHPFDAGADLHSTENCILAPGQRRVIGTGVAVALPPGTVGLVHPRSGLAANHGITIVNSPGTIDAGYRGEIRVCLLNTDPHTSFEIRRGDRIAQLVIVAVIHAQFVPVAELDDTARGTGGYGSTGLGKFDQPGSADHSGSEPTSRSDA